MNSRNRKSNAKRSNNSAAKRLADVVHQVNKVQPFVVRKNAQLLSVPAHKESGLNMERIFRVKGTPGASAFSLTQSLFNTALLEELGIDTTLFPLDVTIKEIRVYSSLPLTARFVYRTGNQNDRSMVASDYTNSAGLASICVVYPVSSRLNFLSTSTSSDVLVQIGSSSPTGATERDFIIFDVLARISSRNTTFDPTFDQNLQVPMEIDDN
jgi:hypothetical protein